LRAAYRAATVRERSLQSEIPKTVKTHERLALEGRARRPRAIRGPFRQPCAFHDAPPAVLPLDAAYL